MFHPSSTFVKGERAKALLNSITVDVEDYFQTEAMSSVVAREQWNQLPTRVERNTKRLFDLGAYMAIFLARPTQRPGARSAGKGSP